jgi:Transposase domain (DUF772)/Transposase DDE domain
MADQLSFASLEFVAKKKRTKRDVFLGEMAAVVPWARLEALIEPHYPKMGPQGGRRPFPLSTMLRIYCLQQWYNLSDPGAEEALYDIQSMRAFCGLEFGRDAIPDETTILNFRHLLERHELTKAIFEGVAEHLAAKGELLRGGTIVDATLIAASPSTKNREQKRDPEMTQSKKGNQWYFGMKAHIGVDAMSGLVHTAGVTTGKFTTRRSWPISFARMTRPSTATRATRAMIRSVRPKPPTTVGREREGEAGPRSYKASACQEPPLRQGARQGRARLSRAEMPVRLSQGPLSRTGQEQRAGVLPARACQSPVGLRPLEGKCRPERPETAAERRSNTRKSKPPSPAAPAERPIQKRFPSALSLTFGTWQ